MQVVKFRLNKTCCSKSVWEVMIQDNEEHSTAAFIRALCCLITVVSHAYSYAKYPYLGALYLPLHFGHIDVNRLYIVILMILTQYLLIVIKIQLKGK